MKLHDYQHREQRVPGYGSRSTQDYASSSSQGHPSVTVSHLHSTGVVSRPPSCSSRTHSHGQPPAPTPGDAQWRLSETDRWSVDSPKESGYYSEESSVGHNAEAGTGSSMHQGSRGTELCKYSSLYSVLQSHL